MSTEGTWKTKSKFNDSLTVQSNCFFVDLLVFAAEIRTKFENRKLKSFTRGAPLQQDIELEKESRQMDMELIHQLEIQSSKVLKNAGK